ncbi:hypothetical protein M0813_24483 [Anaeramoeba flamelloides]|uniref:Uncharacterized protein n=1 Tax=Anaeramoeba flamelloides TaxID=1746091 RepID=A0ABQ8Y5Q3_9EUKA|nr:hypothetical protein M0813_24483 [Anaeramoeba flamelloides]
MQHLVLFVLILSLFFFSTGSAPHGDLTLVPKGDTKSDSVFAFFLQNAGKSKMKSDPVKGHLSLCELLGIPNRQAPQSHLPALTNKVKGNLLINILGVGENDLRKQAGLGLLQKTLENKWILQFDKRYTSNGDSVSVLTSLLSGEGYKKHQIHDPFWLTTDYKPKNVINDLLRENHLGSNIYSISSSETLAKFAFGDFKEEEKVQNQKKGDEKKKEQKKQKTNKCWYLSENGDFNSPRLQKRTLSQLIHRLNNNMFGHKNREANIVFINETINGVNTQIVKIKMAPSNQKFEFDLKIKAERDFIFELIMADQLMSSHKSNLKATKGKGIKEPEPEPENNIDSASIDSWTITFDSLQRIDKKKLPSTLHILDTFLSKTIIKFVKLYEGDAAIEMLFGGKNYLTKEERHEIQSRISNAIHDDFIVTDQIDTEKLLPEIYLSAQMGNAAIKHICEEIKHEFKNSNWKIICSGIIGEGRLKRERPISTRKWYTRETLAIDDGSLLHNRKLSHFKNSNDFFDNSWLRYSLQFFFALLTILSLFTICGSKIENSNQNVIQNEKKNK